MNLSLLQHIPKNFEIETTVNPARINIANTKKQKDGYIVYICERELRYHDNFAIKYANSKANKLHLPIKFVHPKIEYEYEPKKIFIEKQLTETKNEFRSAGIKLNFIQKENLSEYLNHLDINMVIVDFNPIIKRESFKDRYKIIEIDGHNIIPARYISQKQEYGAFTLRKKIYSNIDNFLTEYGVNNSKTECMITLKDFTNNKLEYYAEHKNNPSYNVLSGLSKYLNLGFISAQRTALEVIKSKSDILNKETFLEELVIRKELADNFCLYCKNYKSLSCIPNWAKLSLDKHKEDIRLYTYSLKKLEEAKTHDILWNSTQNQLVKDGVIHGYLRMYWAKKILEWTQSPENALRYAIYLNNKYAYDAPSPSGYTNILWAIGGLHDRAFQDWYVTGKVRRMTYYSIKRKVDLSSYIDKYSKA